jgi:hypothetical protein
VLDYDIARCWQLQLLGYEEKKKNLIACRGLGRVVGPLLAARALPLRCAASTVLSSALLAI